MQTSTRNPQLQLSTVWVNWRIVRYAPRPFLLHTFFTLVAFGLWSVPALIEKAVFDTLTGHASVTFDVWWLLALYLSVEAVRVCNALAAEWYGWTFRRIISALLTRNLFASILRRVGDSPLPLSSGEAVNRLRADVDEVADFPTWLPRCARASRNAGVAMPVVSAPSRTRAAQR